MEKKCKKRNWAKYSRVCKCIKCLPERNAAVYESVKKNRIKNPESYKARKLVFVARRNGTLKKLPCVECGNKKSEAHHEDYSKPFEIIWLCKKHHVIYDKESRLRLLMA